MAVTRTFAQQRGSIGGNTTWSRHDPAPAMARVRAGKLSRLRERVIEADPTLTDEVEIERRIECLRRADMQKLSLLAAKARKLKAEMRALDHELSAAGLADAGSDGVDAD